LENFKNILKEKNLKVSSARIMIMEKLAQAQAHYSAEELFQNLKPNLPGLSLATVYKNLEDMRMAGLLRLVTSSNQIKKYEWERGDHLHLVFENRIVDLEDDALFDSVKNLISKSLKGKFDLEGLDIQIFGKPINNSIS
jgi:Fe2+ or Zn2+ uptake regulation protein